MMVEVINTINGQTNESFKSSYWLPLLNLAGRLYESNPYVAKSLPEDAVKSIPHVLQGHMDYLSMLDRCGASIPTDTQETIDRGIQAFKRIYLNYLAKKDMEASDRLEPKGSKT